MKSHLVLEYIINTATNAIKSECSKQLLNLHKNCEPYSLFTRMDRDDKGYLTKEDFINYLRDNDIIIDENRITIDLFFEYYDTDFNGKLTYDQFLNFVLNQQNFIYRKDAYFKKCLKIHKNQFLEDEIERLLTDCILNDFYLFEYAHNKKLEIFNNLIIDNEDLSLINLFMELDQDKNALINVNDIVKYAYTKKVNLNANEFYLFLNIFDEDKDGYLNWDEFLFMILPSSLQFQYDLDSLKKQELLYYDFYKLNYI